MKSRFLFLITALAVLFASSLVVSYYFSVSYTSSRISSQLEIPSNIAFIASNVERNNSFVSVENGTHYVLAAYSGYGSQINNNGTNVSGEYLLFFDHYNGYFTTACDGKKIQSPLIASEIRVITAPSGEIVQINFSSNQYVLNTNSGCQSAG